MGSSRLSALTPREGEVARLLSRRWTSREIADALGISVSNVKVRLLRARLMLRERLTHEFGDESTRVEPGHDHDHLLPVPGAEERLVYTLRARKR